MQLLRVARNPWGQEIVLGVSWELLWLFTLAGALFIVSHALYRALHKPSREKP